MLPGDVDIRGMKGEINLLPTGQAKARLAVLYLRQSGRLLRWGFVGGLIVLAVPLASLVANRQITNQQAAEQLADADQAAFLAELEETNAFLAAVAERSDTQATPTGYVADILDAMPNNAAVTSLVWDASEQVIKLTGTIARRQDSITIQNRLEEIAAVTRVTAPLSNFQTGAATEFSLTIHYAEITEE